MLIKVIESQLKSSNHSNLSQHFMEYVAPHVENCQAFKDGEEEMEVQKEEDADEDTSTAYQHVHPQHYLPPSGHKRNLTPEGRQKNVTSKNAMFQSEVTNYLLLTESVNNERDDHMSEARTGNYTEGGFPEMQ